MNNSVQLNKELSDLLKSMREQSGISAKELALKINKSSSFISKLENGKCTTINNSTLNDILKYVVVGNSNREDIYKKFNMTYTYSVYQNIYDNISILQKMEADYHNMCLILKRNSVMDDASIQKIKDGVKVKIEDQKRKTIELINSITL